MVDDEINDVPEEVSTPWPDDEADDQAMKSLLKKRNDLRRQLQKVEEDIHALAILNSIAND
jgi:hypothetical protein